MDVWAEEGGLQLRLREGEQSNRRIVEIIDVTDYKNPNRVLASVTIAAFRWQRIAEFFSKEAE